MNTDFTLKNCLFRFIKLYKNADPGKYKYIAYLIEFDFRYDFSFLDRSILENFIAFVTDLSSFVQTDNKDTLVLEGPTQRLDDTTLTVEFKYPIKFSQSRKRFVFILHYNGINSFLFVNATKIY